MGQALYRKYRSRSLKEIVGQEHITDTLTVAIRSGRISHAYLFTGPKGVGKTSIARILAHEINGLPYDDEQAHIDIIEIDAASNRRIDEIRELRDKIHVVPAMAKYKVYIIDEVHMLTREAFNALLKTLEEPPAHAIFILATTEVHKLPETIVSRTQRYVFRPIEHVKAVKHLRSIASKEKIAVTDEALELIVEHGNGSFRDSISLLDQLGNMGGEIDLAAVQRVLGIAPAAAVDALLTAIRSGEAASATYGRLTGLFDQGYQPASVAKQLAAALRTKLVSGSASTTNDTALLRTLLEVPLSHDPEAFLEVALLGYSAAAAPQAAAPVQAVRQTAPSEKPATKPAERSQSHLEPAATEEPPKVKIVTPELVGQQPAPVKEAAQTDTPKAAARPASKGGAQLNPETWQEVLNLLKKQHNTLYGIVRMAQPDFSKPGELHLAFGFAFHQKRANEGKNRKIIGDAIVSVTGNGVEISCTYDSEAKVAQPVLVQASEKAAPAADDGHPLSTISNIFGGVEMVE
jgi:DNA polymerase-3 subunit gamma/tau